jgi:hypothetical protein
MNLQNKLSQTGFYVFLIPVFFVLHGALENFGFIPFRDCFILVMSYIIAAALIWLATGLYFRNHRKTALFTAFLLSFYLFFGSLDDFLKAHIRFLSHYVVIMPAFLFFFIAGLVYLKKTKKDLRKLTFFLNGLLIIYLLLDTAGFIWKSFHPDKNKMAIYEADKKNNYTACDSCPNPDIYFLLFDEYASTVSLKESFHVDNSSLDSFLLQKGFSIQRFSHSNYNFTPFSMASILNMNYISGIKNPDSCTFEDYAKCNKLIWNNKLIDFFSSRNYDIVNYSVFDLAGNPTLVQSRLLPVKTSLITEQTLYIRLMHDIGWNLVIGKFYSKWVEKNRIYSDLNNNNLFLAAVKQESRKKSSHPRFVYVHLTMPHFPYYYDEHFQMRNRKELLADMDRGHVDSYIKYLPYTNKNLKELIDTIQKNTNRSAAIILMGDHGYRVSTNDGDRTHYFKNLNAVYFPDKNYQLLTDTITGVNQFRIILNSMFKQNLPLLQDSTVFLTDKP